MNKIDLKDRKILLELDINARIPASELAKKVGLSRQAVEYRIERLKKRDIIYGARTIFDIGVIGYNLYRVIFRLVEVNKEQKEEFIKAIENNDRTFWLGEIGGNWDAIANFACKDHYEFNVIFEKLVAKFGKYIKDYEVITYIHIHDQSRDYILKERKQRTLIFHEMKNNPDIKLDELDHSIIRTIGSDALITNVELGNRFNVSPNTIKNRIREMERNKLILGYRMFVNPTKLGRVPFMLFLEITRLDLKREKDLYNFLETLDEVTFIVKHIGRWRIGMEVEAESVEQFQEIFVKIRGRFGDIISNFESFPLFRDRNVNYFPVGILSSGLGK